MGEMEKTAGVVASTENRLPYIHTKDWRTNKEIPPSIYDEYDEEQDNPYVDVSDHVPASALTRKYKALHAIGDDVLTPIALGSALLTPVGAVGGTYMGAKRGGLGGAALGALAGTAIPLGLAGANAVAAGHAQNAASNELKKKISPEAAEELRRIDRENQEKSDRAFVSANEKKAAGTLGDFIKGDRDFSDPRDRETTFWKDRVGGQFTGAAPGMVIGEALRKTPSAGAKAMAIPVSWTVGAATNTARGKALAEKNNVEWSPKNTASTTLIPFVSPDSVVKKKVRQKDAEERTKNAAEALIEAVIYKQASVNQAYEADLVAEASEKALNALGYSMFAK
jgi:hypothetical protein